MRMFAIIALLISLSGCSWFTNNGEVSLSRVKFAVDTGVMAFVIENPNTCPRAVEITNRLREQSLKGGGVLVSELMNYARQETNWRVLTNEQTILLMGAYGFVESELIRQLEERELNPKYRITVQQFILLLNRSVITTCATYWSDSGAYIASSYTIHY